MHTKILPIAAGLAAGVLIGLLLPAQARWGAVPDRSGPAAGDAVPAAASAIDRHFIEQMIPHHDGAIAMAELALDRAQRQEIRDLARQIVAAQTRENRQMRSWYQAWYGREVPSAAVNAGGMMAGGMMAGSGMHMGGREDLDALRSAADFDRAFIEQMIPHHQMAVMMARMLAAGTARPEMADFARSVIDAQSGEIEAMRSWYASWYR